jgi:hypothetical protein
MNFFEPETGEFVKSQCAVADGAGFEKHFSVTIDFRKCTGADLAVSLFSLIPLLALSRLELKPQNHP